MAKFNGQVFYLDQQVSLTNTTASSFSYSTSIVKLSSVLIPANTFAQGDILTLESCVSTSGGSGSDSWSQYFYWNETDDLTTPTQLGFLQTTPGNYGVFGLTRRISIRSSNGSGNGSTTASTTLNRTNDLSVMLNEVSRNLVLDWTIDSYIITAGSVSAGTVGIRSEYLKITN